MQALLFVLLLVLEQGGYGPNIEMIQEALRTNLSLIRGYQQLRQTLQQELPEVAKICSLSSRRANSLAWYFVPLILKDLERFFGTLKRECTSRARFATHEEARTAIFEDGEVY